MKREENNSALGFWLALAFIAAVLWVALIVAKAIGAARLSWPAALLSCIWISVAVIAAGIFVIVGGDKLGKIARKLKKRRHQREMIRTISETMKILTMNGVGGVYGVKREPGESNRHKARQDRRGSRAHPRLWRNRHGAARADPAERLQKTGGGGEMTDYQTAAEPRAHADGVPVFCAHDEIVEVEKLIPNPKNPNTHPDTQIQALGRIIRQTGWRQPITVSRRSGFIVKGHGRLSAALLEGLAAAPVEYQNYTSEAEEYADLVADNRIAELAEIDNKMLADIFADIDTGEIPLELTGFTEDEVAGLITAMSEALHNDLHEPDQIPELPEPDDTITQKGDLWILGRHRVVCGNSTNDADVELLLDGEKPEILLTDPPYCSGGFQESGKSSGSIGTKRKGENGKTVVPTISSDTLSTRGYTVLMKAVLDLAPVKVAYIFTDWRMWTYLFDIVEAAGLGVRNMLVWNKKSPGMGNGWRAQHELVMFAHRTKPQWDNHKGYGNVIEATRSGNELHPTQKPVEIPEKLLDNTAWAAAVFDPFGGSGTTLIAAESIGQPAYLMEMEPAFVDVIVKRYIRTTGNKAIQLVRGGETVPREEYEDIFNE